MTLPGFGVHFAWTHVIPNVMPVMPLVLYEGCPTVFFFFFVFLNYNLFSYSQSYSHILVHSSISSGVRGDLAEAVRVFSPPNCI